MKRDLAACPARKEIWPLHARHNDRRWLELWAAGIGAYTCCSGLHVSSGGCRYSLGVLCNPKVWISLEMLKVCLIELVLCRIFIRCVCSLAGAPCILQLCLIAFSRAVSLSSHFMREKMRDSEWPSERFASGLMLPIWLAVKHRWQMFRLVTTREDLVVYMSIWRLAGWLKHDCSWIRMNCIQDVL